MSVLRELLDLPVEVTKSAFVIRLAEAVERPEVLLDTYAITDDIHHALDQGLEKIGGAVRERRNRAAIVHGSFGSGKSHYMAVLSLLAGNNSRAWSEPKLHDLLVKHEWVKTTQLLRLHLNLIGAPTLGERLFGGYLAEMHRRHPDAPIAPLFVDAALFDNAGMLRSQLGEAAFFARLNEGQKSDSRWGKRTEDAWSAARFEAALASGDPEVRGGLLSVLVKTVFPAFASNVSAYLPIGPGLLAMTRHAQSLGYEGISLFLDELILWLVSKAANPDALNAEIGNLATLIEGQSADQPIGVAIFAARQRDIAELVGEQYIGQDAQNVRAHMGFWSGRFDTITLPDRNLPAIIEKRVVHPKDEAARKRLGQAFESLHKTLGPNVWGTLLGPQGDEPAFRKVYPFSPALVDALITLSMCLQRERTALKVLVEMLVGQLEDFEIGKVVPVGDLYDALAEGEDPLDGRMRDQFAKAKRVYQSELLPAIQAKNQTDTKEKCQRLRNDPEIVGCANCRETRCRNENRLAKTLLLAALAPEAQVFKGLTASRLVQLNHGTLKAPVPGSEGIMAAQVLRAWSSQIDKVRVGDQEDPTVSLVLEGVDLRPVLQSAGAYDTPGARRAKLRELLFAALELDTDENTIEGHRILWRGTERIGTIQFGNVRELDDAALRARDSEAWKLVVDYPFDEPGHGPHEDEQRVARFLESSGTTPTVVWLPSFLSDGMQDHLGELVIIDRLLSGETWRQYLSNARPEDQARAKDGLQSLARQKRDRLEQGLAVAYGLQSVQGGVLDPGRTLDQHFYALSDGIRLRNPNAASLGKGMSLALEQLLDERYPRHPMFGTDKITRGRLEKELELFTRLCESDPQRLPLARNEQDALRCADVLELVRVRDGQATLFTQTFDDLDQRLHAENLLVPEVRTLARLLDPEGVRGLTREVSDFVILAYAAAKGREMLRGGQPVRSPMLGKLDADIELLQPRLPEEGLWHQAVDRAGKIFGIAVGRARTARNLRALADQISGKVTEARRARAHEIAELLKRRSAFYEAGAAREQTAVSAAALLEQLSVDDAGLLVERLAAARIATSEAALQRHLTTAREVADLLGNEVHFISFSPLAHQDSDAPRALMKRLGEALSQDELQQPLVRSLNELSIAAQRLLTPVEAPLTPARAGGGFMQVASDAELRTLADRLREQLKDGPLEIHWSRKP